MLGKAVFCGMLEARKRFPFLCCSAPLGFRSSGKPPIQRIQIDLKHKYSIEQIDEAIGIASTAAKECGCVGLIRDQRTNLRKVPDPRALRISAAILHGFPR